MLFRAILDDHSTPNDVAMLAAVAKGLAQFEFNTNLFLDLTEQLFTNFTTNKTFALVDVSDAEVSRLGHIYSHYQPSLYALS